MNAHPGTDIGWMLQPEYRKKGHCTQALRLLLPFLKGRLIARIISTNIPSRNLAKKVGFKYNGYGPYYSTGERVVTYRFDA